VAALAESARVSEAELRRVRRRRATARTARLEAARHHPGRSRGGEDEREPSEEDERQRDRARVVRADEVQRAREEPLRPVAPGPGRDDGRPLALRRPRARVLRLLLVRYLRRPLDPASALAARYDASGFRVDRALQRSGEVGGQRGVLLRVLADVLPRLEVARDGVDLVDPPVIPVVDELLPARRRRGRGRGREEKADAGQERNECEPLQRGSAWGRRERAPSVARVRRSLVDGIESRMRAV
jgi:hypothetical protein